MIFGMFALAVALAISAVAAYYSIIGLTAIFAAAFWPIVIMGTALEIGKIVAVTWLHNYWDRAGWKIKAYLLPAVIALMLITSMGIFGFLSKAHSNQTIVSGDASARVALYDEKIQTQRENIEVARNAIQQMNKQVDELLARGTTEQNAQRAANLRRQQAAERNRLQQDIARAQAEIQKLQEERAPLASSLRKIEAEVGPIKYIAAMIYGDNPDTNLLERAVRWMIILIVLVFDPLAITLILAANKNFEWHRQLKSKKQEDTAANTSPQTLDISEHIKKDLEEKLKINEELLQTTQKKLNELIFNYEQAKDEIKYLKEQQQKSTLDVPLANGLPDSGLPAAEIPKMNQDYDDSVPPIWEQLIEIGKSYPESPVVEKNTNDSKTPVTEVKKKNRVRKPKVQKQAEPTADKLNPVLHDELTFTTEPKQETLKNVVEETKEKKHLDLKPAPIEKTDVRISKAKPLTKEELADLLKPQATGKKTNFNFGTAFSENPEIGDTFLRIDTLPHRLYKWNGLKWIEVDKSISTAYAYDVEYIKYLINKISSGEYDVDDLSDVEQDQIKKYLEENNG